MALYSLVFEYSVYGEKCQNRFHYASASPGPLPSGALRLFRGWQADVLPTLADLMTNNGGVVTFDRAYSVNLYDDTDFYEDFSLNPAVPSGDHGAALPTFVALTFVSPRYRVGKNRAYKRFGGLGEGDVVGNEFTNSTAANAVQAAIAEPVTDPSSLNEFTPRLLFLNPNSNPPYQLYPTEAEQLAESAEIILIAYRNLTTQRSRKAGVGQ